MKIGKTSISKTGTVLDTTSKNPMEASGMVDSQTSGFGIGNFQELDTESLKFVDVQDLAVLERGNKSCVSARGACE